MKTSKRIALLAVTLTLSTSAQANFLKDLFEKFGSINKEEKSECAKMDNDEVAALCVEEVCGDPTKHPVILNAETVKKYNTENTEKLMNEVEKEIRSKEARIEKLVELAVKSQGQIAAINDPSQLSDIDSKEILIKIIQEINEEHKLLQKINPFKSKGEKIKLIVPPNSPYSKIYKDVIAKINLEQHPSLREFVGAKSTGAGVNAEQEPTLCSTECKQHLITYLKSRPAPSIEEIVKKEREKFDFEDSIAECRAAVSLNHVEAQNSEEIQKEWPKLIERLEKDTRLKLSAHSKALILEKIKNDLTVKFNVPVTRVASVLKPSKSNYQAFHDKSEIATAYTLTTKSSMKNFEEAIATPRCHQLDKAVNLSDHVAFKPQENKGDLVVSPFSCEHAHLGKEIMAHELGHAVSYFIAFTPGMSKETKEDFKKLRECSRQEKRTTKFPGLFSPHEGDKWTTEEDTADLFAYALSEDKENMIGCALAVPDGKDYTALGMKKSFFDTHSSGIQRLMVELQYKNPGKITEACEEVIKRSKSKITKQCL